VEKVYTIVNPVDGPFMHNETNQIFKVDSNFIGVKAKKSRWAAQRWSEQKKKLCFNGSFYDEKTAAHASDTLARKLMANGEQCHALNFPDDHTEVHREETSSKFIGVSYACRQSKWVTSRRSKIEKKMVSNGSYNDEETAAHASDNLARKLMRNGEQVHKLNFPDISQYIGVSYNNGDSKLNKWLRAGLAVVLRALLSTDPTMMKQQQLMRVILWPET